MPEIQLPRDPSHSPPLGLVVTDLDGTLLGSDRRIADADLAALESLGQAGYARAIATGRSLYSYERLCDARTIPVDFIVFSSGSGIRCEPGGEILKRPELSAEEVSTLTALLLSADVDFMIHDPVPVSHRFAWHAVGGGCPDFRQRLAWYRDCHRTLESEPAEAGPASQFLVIVPAGQGVEVLGWLDERLSGYNVIRTTSPLDHESTWIEIFPITVSKGLTMDWIAGELGLTAADALAVGNDYNDLDLLEWAGTSFVVANAPAELRERFETVPANDHGGFAEAVERWLATRSTHEQ